MMFRCFVLFLAYVLIGASCLFGADLNPNWSASFDEDIKWYKMTPPGHIAVATKHELTILDPATGTVAWSKTCDKSLKWGCFEPIEGTPLVILTAQKDVFGKQPHVTLLDVTTGGELWTSARFGIGESFGHLVLPPLNALMFYGVESEGSKKKCVVVVDFLTGDVIWRQQEMFKKWDPHRFDFGGFGSIAGNQEPLFDTDSTMILYLNKNSLRKYNCLTGEMIWESSGKLKRRKSFLESGTKIEDQPCAGPKLGYAAMVLSHDGATIYAPYQNTVGAFRTEDGQALWKKPDKLLGIAVDMAETEHGLLVRSWDGSYSELKLLDFNSGEKIWMAPSAEGSFVKKAFASNWSETSNMILSDTAIYIATSTDLFQVDPVTGHHERISPLGFDGIEEWSYVEPREDGYLITGLQNLAWFSPDWNLLDNAYFRPADNVGAGLLSLVAAVGFEVIGTRSVGSGASLTLSGDILGAAETMFEDFSATAESENYLFVLSEPLDGEFEGLGLLRVSKVDGSVANRIPLDTKEPDYKINYHQNSLIMKPGKRQLLSYQF